MLSKAQIKLLRSLQLKKYRDAEGLFIAEGNKIVQELLGSDIAIEHIYISEGHPGFAPGNNEMLKQVQHNHIGMRTITREELDKISTLATPQGVLAICRLPKETKTQPDFKKELILALDDIRDPGNMGTIMRIADWFGIKHIYCSEECVDVYNPKVVQASMGSVARVKVHDENLPALLKNRAGEGINIYGALLNGKNMYEEKNLSANGILVIGNESKGISKEVQEYITHPLSIPSYNAYPPESLNAAIATAILCAELRRRG